MAALRASRLVWSETCPTVLVTSPMLAACWLNCSMTETEPACRSPFCLMLLAHAPIWFEVSASRRCSSPSAGARPPDRALDERHCRTVATASVSCDALAASSAPLAICSIARRSSSAADAASLMPLASSSLAAAIAFFDLLLAPGRGRYGSFRCGALGTAAAGRGHSRSGLKGCLSWRERMFS